MVYLRDLRQMFYLVTPWETSYPAVQAVPKMIDEGIPWFNLMIVLEILYFVKKGEKYMYSVNDSLTSMGSGLLQITVKLVSLHFDFWLYCYVHRNYVLMTLPWDSAWTWLASFLAVDFGYYWFHRAAHEVNVFWSFHQTHHSSEHYNLSTALRQGMFQPFVSAAFYLPFALFIPPQVHLVHANLNLLYQFWIHTQTLPKLGFLEYLINTPSHHRVHHGRNRYCIDKNYGATLIVWDRLFGTFQAEKDEEPVAYGLVHNVKTFDAMYIQLFHFKYALWDKPRSVEGFTNKLKAIFYGPGWFPGTGRMGNLEDIPEIESPITLYDVPAPLWHKFYSLFHGAFLLLSYRQYSAMVVNISYGYSVLFTAWIIYSVYVVGAIAEKSKNFQYLELIRLGLLSHVIGEYVLWTYDDEYFNTILRTITFVSELFWLIYVLKLATDSNAKKVN